MKTSNCCESSIIEETDICKKCGEHCESRDSIEQIQQKNRRIILVKSIGNLSNFTKIKSIIEDYFPEEKSSGKIEELAAELDIVFAEPKIDLSRVLLALKNDRWRFCCTSAGYFTRSNVDSALCYWDLTKETLEEQSEETQREINNLLKEGIYDTKP